MMLYKRLSPRLYIFISAQIRGRRYAMLAFDITMLEEPQRRGARRYVNMMARGARLPARACSDVSVW